MDKDIKYTNKKVDESWKDTIDKEKHVNKSKDEASAPEKEEPTRDEAVSEEGTMNFTMLISSLAMQTMLHMGDIANPATGNKEENLDAAKEVIDILGILEKKTKGNLTSEEENMLTTVLYDIRMRYVQKNK